MLLSSSIISSSDSWNRRYFRTMISHRSNALVSSSLATGLSTYSAAREGLAREPGSGVLDGAWLELAGGWFGVAFGFAFASVFAVAFDMAFGVVGVRFDDDASDDCLAPGAS